MIGPEPVKLTITPAVDGPRTEVFGTSLSSWSSEPPDIQATADTAGAAVAELQAAPAMGLHLTLQAMLHQGLEAATNARHEVRRRTWTPTFVTWRVTSRTTPPGCEVAAEHHVGHVQQADSPHHQPG